jgi:sodium transport system ATP-binding protein
MIQVHGVAKFFGHTAAVQGLSFEAPDCSITGLLGANGAGKTTTLRMIAGVLEPDAGEIRVGGGAGRQSDGPAELGALLDHTGLYGRLTARENLEYFGRLRGMPAKLIEARVKSLLASLGLGEIADRPTARFSQGEHLKVALGRALLHNPRHLLLDEPTNGLDVPTLLALRALLKQLRNEGVCILFSSHVLGEVQALCDRVVVVARGRVVAEGTLADVQARAGTDTLEQAFVKLTAAVAEESC